MLFAITGLVFFDFVLYLDWIVMAGQLNGINGVLHSEKTDC